MTTADSLLIADETARNDARDTCQVLHVTLLGVPAFRVNDRQIVFKSRKAEGLLIRLCLAPSGRVTRETAADLFWGDSSEHHARSSLRQTLLILRRTLEAAGFTGVSSDKLNIALDLDHVRLDVDLFRGGDAQTPVKLLTEKRLSELLVEGGELLSDAFAAWLRVCRQRFHDRIRASLEPVIAQRNGDPKQLEEAALALLNLDPTHEPACRAFMMSRALRGDSTAALRAYEDLWNLLDEEFDTQPSAATQDLLVDIKLGRLGKQISVDGGAHRPAIGDQVRDAASAGAVNARGSSRFPEDDDVGAPRPAKCANRHPVIIVEDVLQAGHASDDLRAAAVFRNDLIARLARFRNWTVLDASPARPGWHGGTTYRAIISIMGSGHTLAFALAVKNIETQAFVWGWSTDAVGVDAIAQGAVVTSDIALSINAYVLNEDLHALLPEFDGVTGPVERGTDETASTSVPKLEDSRRAEDVLMKIIEDRPQFAGAYSSLAEILNARRVLFPGHVDTADHLQRTAKIARRAMDLDPMDGRGFLAAAWNAARQGLFDPAMTLHRRALKLAQCDPSTAMSAALGLACLGLGDEAAKIGRYHRDMGLLTAPSGWNDLVGIMVLTGNCDDAIWAYRRVDGGYMVTEAWYAAALAMVGDIEEAIRHRHRLEALLHDRWIAPTSPTRSDMARWLVSCFPIVDCVERTRFHEGCIRSGLSLPDDVTPDRNMVVTAGDNLA